MKATAILAAAMAAAPLAVRASIFGFDTFGETSCNGFEEFIHITQPGSNINKFPGPRKSFLVLETDHTCVAILCTGTTFNTGVCIQFGLDLAVGTCFGYSDGSAANSFDILCASGSPGAKEEGDGGLNLELV
ncbi:hypothetical protein FGG08_002669 [Glutinoglossum americanum]|uniref:Uncharacterized protein n=1 Tax=Glutinoglossum americanum TaxID=1670608 RepID=A0A9P8L5E3_9PEZI|nr:hypothetical protein FGG08_002669 [Glutinoglossum americanum]